jgi:hypothetical protein
MRQRQIAASAATVTRFVTTCDADFTGQNVTTAQPIFPAAQDTFTSLANMTYDFTLMLSVTNGATTCTKALSFGGTAVISSIRYAAMAQNVAVNSAGATQSSGHYDTAASTVVLATGTTPWWLLVDGMMRITTAGTIIPQITFSADPTGTILFKQNSFMRLQTPGSDTFTGASGWG